MTREWTITTTAMVITTMSTDKILTTNEKSTSCTYEHWCYDCDCGIVLEGYENNEPVCCPECGKFMGRRGYEYE